MDGLSNVFPSGKRLIKQIERDDAINALGLKLDCISFLKKRSLLSDSALNAVEEDTRQRLRQVKYETDVSGGRIHLNPQKLTNEIEVFFRRKFFVFRQDSRSRDQREIQLREYLKHQSDRLFIDELAHHICYSNKMAIDYLLSNLRHNFLRFKLESAIDKAFQEHHEPNVVPFKKAITIPLDYYCETWLTISKERSFYVGIVQRVADRLPIAHPGNPESYILVSEAITESVVEHFEHLLTACKQAWGSQTKNVVIRSVLGTLNNSEYSSDTVLKEALEHELENIFTDTEGWLAINSNPIRKEFELKELFLFEATNFSSAKTRRRPISVTCYDKPDGEPATRRTKDILISGELFAGVVQLVQNLLENAFQYCSLPMATTLIDIKLFDLGNGATRIEFRNTFARQLRDDMRRRVVAFNKRVEEAKSEASSKNTDAPVHVGGSGLKRIYFDLHDYLGDKFSIKSLGTEIGSDIFLVVCELFDQGPLTNE